MDIEKLFGKLLHEVTGSGGNQFNKKHKKYKKKYKHKGGDGYYRQGASSQHVSKKRSLLDNLTGNLTSGKGLLTAIGLGVGAYEIYRTSKQTQQRQAAVGVGAQYSPQATPVQVASAAPPPPPPPTGAQQEQAMNPVSPVPTSSPQTASVKPLRTALDEQDVARRLIQVMVGAAHADGMLDSEEERVILDRLRAVELAQEEKMFLLEELHHPRSLAELTQGIEDVRLGQAMYAVAASAVIIDTESERRWFDELGSSLGLSPEVCQFIEENK
ncbi:MAG: DUF533 domain-containing protein [Candidatus Electrothrix sp. Rat3]|nr:DUF533 domain-containing protein [Candidatus Electrothrix rattekaaiensis]